MLAVAEVIDVQVSYALPQRCELIRLSLPAGSTVAQAIEASGLRERHPDLDIDGRNKVGIYAKLTRLGVPLRDLDRVEIYRPLIADPKAVRKQRADAGKTMKKGGGAAQA